MHIVHELIVVIEKLICHIIKYQEYMRDIILPLTESFEVWNNEDVVVCMR